MPTTDDLAESTRRPRTLRRAGVVAVVASFVGVWGYVMYLTIVEGRAEPRDRLHDVAWAQRAEETCARSTPVLESLPLASEADSPTERAGFLEDATDELDTMIGRLAALPPPATADEEGAVDRWLADYRAYVQDRREYEAAQRDRGHPRHDEPFSVTDRAGYHLDVLVDDFARVNFMESCETPDDL